MSDWPVSDVLLLIAMVLVGVISVARTARLLIYDDFPPMVWLRTRFLAAFDEDSKWSKIAECQFCLTPYLSLGLLAWGWLAWGNDAALIVWWIANGAWAGSYLSAILVAYDQPED